LTGVSTNRPPTIRSTTANRITKLAPELVRVSRFVEWFVE
jgi:hypothetical protein